MTPPEKNKLYQELRVIVDTIVKLVEPLCGVEGIICDPWLADIDIWTMGDEDTNIKVLEAIQEKFNLNDEQITYIDSYTTLIQMALFIYLADQ
jgi:hypothetical protein